MTETTSRHWQMQDRGALVKNRSCGHGRLSQNRHFLSIVSQGLQI